MPKKQTDAYNVETNIYLQKKNKRAGEGGVRAAVFKIQTCGVRRKEPMKAQIKLVLDQLIGSSTPIVLVNVATSADSLSNTRIITTVA